MPIWIYLDTGYSKRLNCSQIVEGSLEVKLPTIWTDWKAEVGRVREAKGKKMQVREKVEKTRLTMFFQWFVAPEGRKVGSLKRRVRSHLARWEMKNCTPLWREAHFQVKMLKTPLERTTFEGSDVVLRGKGKGFCTLPKVSKTWWFCSSFKNDGRRGTFLKRGSGKVHVAWQVQYKRHVHQRC